MIGSSSYYTVVRAIDSFCLGAAMQTSPMLDDYGGMDEPDDTLTTNAPVPHTSVNQGMLFSIPTNKQSKTSTSTNPQISNIKIPPQKYFSYDEYLKIFCGNKDAAGYWWTRYQDSLA